MSHQRRPYTPPQCRSCGAKILFLRTPKGKWLPVDAEPHDEGTVLNVPRRGGDPLARVFTLAEIKRRGGQAYRPHFQTCPNADEHRKPR